MFFSAITVLAFFLKWPLLVSARTINILQLSWLSNLGEPLDDEALSTAQYVVPLALQHFNERYSGIVSAVASTRSCDATLQFAGGMIDDQGLSSVAMLDLVGGSNFKNIDIVHGPVLSDVSVLRQVLTKRN